MTDRDNALWQQYWRDRRTDCHEQAVNPLLTRFWPSLALPPGSRVFVPLCGKSLDLIWLPEQGHEVIGVELSPIAVRTFFRERRLRPSRGRVGKFIVWQHERIRILCGDFFALAAADLGPIDAVYDRAALTALPEAVRRPYLAHLRGLVPASCEVFLLTVEDGEEGESQAQSDATADEITTLYAERFEIELAHVESRFEPVADCPACAPERSEHKVYRLSPRPESA